jgi:Methyltransferase domain
MKIMPESTLLHTPPTRSVRAIRVLKRLVSPIYYKWLRFANQFNMIGQLPWVVGALLVLRRPVAFKFVEIGVFKGDNAVRIIRLAQKFKTNIFYIGFDLFENKDEFFKLHPEDRAVYDTIEHPYWEFQSGQHALVKVQNKISSVLPQQNFFLIIGDSTITLPAYRNELTDASVIYIDGCHDYDVVSQDWQNVCWLMESNPDTVVVFDDMLYPGVGRLRMEITRLTDQYRVFHLNENQYIVTSKKLRWKERQLFMVTEGIGLMRDAIRKYKAQCKNKFLK